MLLGSVEVLVHSCLHSRVESHSTTIAVPQLSKWMPWSSIGFTVQIGIYIILFHDPIKNTCNELQMLLSYQNDCKACMKLWVSSLAPHKLNVVSHAYNPDL